MTKQEKILKRALRLACYNMAHIFCISGYKPFTGEQIMRHFTRKAKEEMK